jgi:hypothetical protein
MSLQATAVAMGWPLGSERRIGSRHIGASRRAPTVPVANREGVSGRVRGVACGAIRQQEDRHAFDSRLRSQGRARHCQVNGEAAVE